MRIFRHPTDLPSDIRGSAIALGNFDGVHLGHRTLIADAIETAVRHKIPSVVVTLEPHPRSFFRPQDPVFRLTPFRAKARRIAELGAQALLTLHFDQALAALKAEAFVAEILVGSLQARHVSVGWDFVFGHDRGGTAQTLVEAGQRFGFDVSVIQPVDSAGSVVSSTRIRQHLREGEVELAAQLLGAVWEIDGRVEHGDARGRTIGFPTANVSMADYLHPKAGVYAVRVGIEPVPQSPEDPVIWYDGVANIGSRPTVGGTEFRVEANLFDFSGDLYDRHLRVALHRFIRPERKFSGIDELRSQIVQDAEAALKVLRE